MIKYTTAQLRKIKAKQIMHELLEINKPGDEYELHSGKWIYLGKSEESIDYTLLRQLQAYLVEDYR